jgi:hypothetical protein
MPVVLRHDEFFDLRRSGTHGAAFLASCVRLNAICTGKSNPQWKLSAISEDIGNAK